MKKILLIDDDKRMNEIIKDYLESNDYQVTTAFDGLEGLRLIEKNQYDLILLDVMMPKVDGWSVCRKIKKHQQTFVMMLTARSDDDDKLMGFDLGADEYMTKPFSQKVLLARIKAIFNRTNIKPAIINLAGIKINLQAYTVHVDKKLVQLTMKEYELMKKFSLSQNLVFTRQQLLDDIWGLDFKGDIRIIDTNIKTLRKKIHPYAGLIQTIIGVGYKLEVRHE